jgi:hypothetical protein
MLLKPPGKYIYNTLGQSVAEGITVFHPDLTVIVDENNDYPIVTHLPFKR